MAENHTLPQIQGVRTRFGVVNAVTGATVPGLKNLYTTDAFVKVGFARVYKEATEIEDENAQGVLCANLKGKPTFKRLDVNVELCTPDPYAAKILDGGDLIELAAERVGYAFPALGEVEDHALSIEVWSKRIKNGALDQSSPYAWWAIPFVLNMHEGDVEVANATRHPVFTGEAYESTNWGDGPANDWPAASDRVAQWIPTATLPALTYASELAAS